MAVDQWSWESHPQKAEPKEANGYSYPANAPYLTWYDDETIAFPLYNAAPQFTIRDFLGNVVRTGGNTTTNFTTAPLPAGHYRVYFTKTGDTAVDAQGEPFNGCLGAANLSIWRRNVNAGMPQRIATQASTGSQDYTTFQELMWALNSFMHRYTIDTVESPNGSTPTLNGASIDHNYHQTHLMAINDPARPRYEVVSCRNGADAAGAVAGMAQIVSTLGTDRLYYEGINEPDNGMSPAQFLPKAQNFYNAVKAANSNALVCGPAQVNINVGQTWSDNFYGMGGGQYYDAVSFHAYNTFDGNLRIARENMDNYVSILEKYGQHNKPRFVTEWGVFASSYGSLNAQRQLHWVMTNVLFLEQYKVPKENFFYFYNKASGFWDYPSFMVTDRCGMLPVSTAMRVYSEEVYGKSFVERLNFGDEDNDYVGSRYQASNGTGLVAIIAAGRQGDQMSFKVTGATSLKVVGGLGSEQTMAVTGGKITVTVPAYPVYIQLPAGVTCVPSPRKLGRNLAIDASWSKTVSSSGNINAYRVTDPVYDRGQNYQMDQPLPITLTTTLPFVQSFDTIHVRGMYPWQTRSGILDAQVQVYQAGSWTTVGTIHNDYQWLDFRTGASDTNCWGEVYYDMRCSWIIDIGHEVRTDQLRLIVTKTTWGGEFQEVYDTPATGQGLGAQGVALMSLEVHNARHASQKQIVVRGN